MAAIEHGFLKYTDKPTGQIYDFEPDRLTWDNIYTGDPRSNSLYTLIYSGMGVCKISDGYIKTGKKDGTSIANNATAEGYNTTSTSTTSHAEGYNTTATGTASHAEGIDSNVPSYNNSSHAEGYQTTISNDYSHAEGYKTTVSGAYSHVEGNQTTAYSKASHAEGYNTKGIGISSSYTHMEGYNTCADHYGNHVSGINVSTIDYKQRTITTSYDVSYGHYSGMYNSINASFIIGNPIFQIGNGSSDNRRNNAFTLYNNGSIELSSPRSSGAKYPSFFGLYNIGTCSDNYTSVSTVNASYFPIWMHIGVPLEDDGGTLFRPNGSGSSGCRKYISIKNGDTPDGEHIMIGRAADNTYHIKFADALFGSDTGIFGNEDQYIIASATNGDLKYIRGGCCQLTSASMWHTGTTDDTPPSGAGTMQRLHLPHHENGYIWIDDTRFYDDNGNSLGIGAW